MKILLTAIFGGILCCVALLGISKEADRQDNQAAFESCMSELNFEECKYIE